MARTRQANLRIKELMLSALDKWTWVSDQGRLYLNAVDNSFQVEMGFRLPSIFDFDSDKYKEVRVVVNGVTIGHGTLMSPVSTRQRRGITYYNYSGEFGANAFLRLLSRVKHPPIAGHNPIAYGPGGIPRPVGHAIFKPVPESENVDVKPVGKSYGKDAVRPGQYDTCIHGPCEDKTEKERDECECNAPTALRRDESNIQTATPIQFVTNDTLRKRAMSERRKRLSVEEREEKQQRRWSWIGLAFFVVVAIIIGAC